MELFEFGGLVVVLLALLWFDLHFFARGRDATFAESVRWSIGWLVLGLSPFFVGIIVVAIVGNAAEHWVAIYFASRDKMDLAVNIAIGSSAQIALFAAPVLVLLSLFVGDFPMALVFNGYELVAVVLVILVANFVVNEGESTWFEGLQLLALYALMGVVFFYA